LIESPHRIESTIADQVHELVRSLPKEKARSILDDAQDMAERTSEERWEELFDQSAKSPNFKAFLEDVRQRYSAGRGGCLSTV
jgi:hypothetical protein